MPAAHPTQAEEWHRVWNETSGWAERTAGDKRLRPFDIFCHVTYNSVGSFS
jgi:hypothetical protein